MFSIVVVMIVLVSGVALAATVRCADVGGWCSGTNKDDRMVGTADRDRMEALGGDDVALGGRGGDRLHGHSGDDELVGGPGNDFLAGEEPETWPGGADVLRGGPGDDHLQGGYGADAVHGGPGDDLLIVDGGETPDRIYCGDGFDRYDIRGTAAGDTSENVYVAPGCEKEVDLFSIY